MNFELVVDVFRNSILITGLVMTMMLMIEFINIQSQGKWFAKLKDSKIRQVILSALLGLIPGCIGGFAAVSLYTHRLISFGALIAMMICSSGDEAFVMLALIPKTALILFALLFVIAVISGIVIDKIYSKSPENFSCKDEFIVHTEQDSRANSILKLSSYKTLLKPIKERVIILLGIALFVAAILFGILEHDHAHHIDASTPTIATTTCTEHNHQEAAIECTEHNHSGGAHSFDLLNERWLNIIFAILSIVTLLFVATANNHFIKEHLWQHVIKKHFLSIFLWTFGALLIIQIGIKYWDMESLIGSNIFIMILIAVAVGVIPESGPHMLFITLFATGYIPFSVLLANSIVQDGHTALPLLAESKSSFFKAKLINMVVGLLFGIAFWSIGL